MCWLNLTFIQVMDPRLIFCPPTINLAWGWNIKNVCSNLANCSSYTGPVNGQQGTCVSSSLACQPTMVRGGTRSSGKRDRLVSERFPVRIWLPLGIRNSWITPQPGSVPCLNLTLTFLDSFEATWIKQFYCLRLSKEQFQMSCQLRVFYQKENIREDPTTTSLTFFSGQP